MRRCVLLCDVCSCEKEGTNSGLSHQIYLLIIRCTNKQLQKFFIRRKLCIVSVERLRAALFMARSLVTLSSLRLLRLNPTRVLFLAVFVVAALLYVSFFSLSINPHSSRRRSDEDNHDDTNLLENQLSMLSTEQLARYHAIIDGRITRADVEIVLSRHHEDVHWSDPYGNIRTVYDKPTNESLALPPPPHTLGKVVRLSNLGRESYTYLWHIVHNYDNLAQLTVFSHGSAPNHGYMGHRRGGGHLLCNSTFHDFVLSESSRGHFIFTGAVWLPTLAHVLRAGYNKETATRRQALSTCPTPLLTEEGGSEYRFDLDDKPHMHLLQHVASLCDRENSTACTGLAFWDKFVQLPVPAENIVFFSQGWLVGVLWWWFGRGWNV